MFFQINLEEFLGIDLAGSPKRPTGLAYIKDGVLITQLVYEDEPLLEKAVQFRYIYIDAPLSLPYGRSHIEQKTDQHFRECDLKLKELKIKFFPITLGGMRKLTLRGMKIKDFLISKNREVYEVFPGAFYDVYQIKRKDKQAILGFFKEFLNCLGISLEEKPYTQDELDGIACLLTGILQKSGLALELTGRDGCIIIPKPLKRSKNNG
ncbi:DUF429 domain-containing protein [Thermodesulfobacterium sp. TA1]|uniref:DUF429 domain-containing protein n=1 Tax=Thermodesulfobacterium sp. TA1 TaxID=2234087 RepID=UPI0012320B20|nr:DUF429 domain-containing protein [Thermodesulfobacterium sp. TA1]QER41788.1 DUF429 domain-containing protein [Thermodesulfobacterium sp. TA1]